MRWNIRVLNFNPRWADLVSVHVNEVGKGSIANLGEALSRGYPGCHVTVAAGEKARMTWLDGKVTLDQPNVALPDATPADLQAWREMC